MTWATECQLLVAGESQLSGSQPVIPELKEISKVANTLLKESYQFIHKIDQATLGLASGIALRGLSAESIKPEQWDKFSIAGTLIYQDSEFSGTALRGAKLIFSESNNSRTLISGTKGEFSESFTKLVTIKRLRLFSGPLFEIRQQSVPFLKVPLKLNIESSICNVQTTLNEIPLEPVVFILRKK